MKVEGKVIIVTGASSGIGRACAAEFVSHGARVTLASRNAVALNELQQTVDAGGERTLVVATDVTDSEACRRMVDATLERFGQIDILMCNAGVSMRADFVDVDLSVMHRLMDVNYWGTVNCVKYALPHLLHARGMIVGISSVTGYIGLPGRSGYSASKFAMRGFLETLRTENYARGLKVLIVAPGFTASNVRRAALTADGTPQGQSPRREENMMSAERVARKIRRAMQRECRKVTFTFFNGKLAVFVNKWWPQLVESVARYEMRREPDSPVKN